MPLADSVTVLECSPGKRLAKVYTDPTQPPDDYDAGTYLRPHVYPVESLQDLAGLLDILRADPTVCVIRGEPKPEALDGSFVRRLVRPRPNEANGDAQYTRAARRWLAVDIDKSDVPFDLATPKAAVEAWRQTLPEGLSDAGMVWTWTAKSHLSPTLRGRAWFWLGEALSDAAVSAWAVAHGFDGAVGRAVQPIYTAAPIFQGCADPLDRTPLVFPGPEGRVTLPTGIAPNQLTAESARVAIEAAGDPNPAFDEWRQKIVERLGDPHDYDNKRYQMSGALAGICRKSGWTQADALALITTWLDGSDDETDPGPVLPYVESTFALESPDAARGFQGLEELTSTALAKDISDLAIKAKYPSARRHLGAAPPAAAVVAEPVAGVYPTLGQTIDFGIEPPPPRWLCQGLGIEAGGKPTALVGLQHSGKGPFSNILAVSVALGLDLFGKFPVEQGPVMILDWETGAYLSRRRIRRICRALGRDPAELNGKLHFFDLVGGAPPDRQQDIERFVADHGIKLAIVDSYTSAMLGQGVDANAVEYANLLGVFAAIARSHDCVVMPLLHARKPEKTQRGQGKRPTLSDVSGTGALAAMVQTAIMLWRPDDEKKAEIEVSCARSIEDPFQTFMLHWTDVPEPGRQSASAQNPKWGLKAEAIYAEAALKADQPSGLRTANDRREADRLRKDAECKADILEHLHKHPFATERELVKQACGGEVRAFDRMARVLRKEGMIDTNGDVWFLVQNPPTPGRRFMNKASK